MVRLENRARSLLRKVVRPTLAFLAKRDTRLDSESAAQLLVGTAIVESGLRKPLLLTEANTRSYYRTDLSLADDINRRYGERFQLFRLVVPARMISYDAEFAMQLRWNTHLACAVVRLGYWTAPEPLPLPGDIAAMAAYWTRWRGAVEYGDTAEPFIRKSGPVIRAIWPYSGDEQSRQVA